MKIAAGHESKHKAAMSKAGDVVVVILIQTGNRNLRMHIILQFTRESKTAKDSFRDSTVF